MVLQCLTWISYVWGQIVSSVTIYHKGFVKPLPDNIIIDILSRLPAECVLECRKVCRSWLALTSSPYFAEMHLKRASPILLVECGSRELDLFIFDGDKRDKNIKKIRAGSMHIVEKKNINPPMLYGSCNGLILLRPMFDNLEYHVCNPVTREQITITSPVRRPGKLCGFFFHSLSKEYRLLYVHRKGICFEYFMYSLEGKLWRKLDAFSYRPTSYETPAILNRTLHWIVEHKYKNVYDIPPCSNSIMMFNMDTEVFSSRPHPEIECPTRLRGRYFEMKGKLSHGHMHLLEMKGELSLYYPTVKLFHYIWVLEDYENWCWVIKYKVNLGCCGARLYPLELGDKMYYSLIRFLDLQNGELLVNWFSKGLFRYHPGQNTLKKIDYDTAGKKMSDIFVLHTTHYIKSFVSLTGF